MSFFKNLARRARSRVQPNPVMGSIRPVSRFEDDFNRMRLPRNAPLGLERLFGRLQQRIRNNPKFQGIRRMPMPVGGGVPFSPPMMPSNMMAAPSLPMPQTIPTERFPMIRPGFSTGEEVRAEETRFVPEEIGFAAAQLKKSLQDAISEAVQMAQNIGAPIIDFVERVKMGYQQGMRELPRPEQFRPVTEKDMEMIRMMERNQRDPASYQTADPRDILGEKGRTISNIDREMLGLMPLEPMLPSPPPPPMMGEVPMFAEGLAVDIENLEKKN